MWLETLLRAVTFTKQFIMSERRIIGRSPSLFFKGLEALRGLRDEGDRMLNKFREKADKPSFEQIDQWDTNARAYAQRRVFEIGRQTWGTFESEWPEGDSLRMQAVRHDEGCFDNEEERVRFGRLWGRAERFKQLIDRIENGKQKI